MKEVADAMDAFAAAWEKPETDRIVPYFNLPMVMISEDWGVIPVNDETTLRNIIGPIVEERIAESYARTDFLGRETKLLGPNLATTSFTEVAYNSSGAELRRFGATYTFLKVDGTWLIAGSPATVRGHRCVTLRAPRCRLTRSCSRPRSVAIGASLRIG